MEQLKGSLKPRIQFKEKITSIIRDVIHVFYNRSGSHFWVRCIYISCICLIVGLTWSLYLIHNFQEARIPGTINSAVSPLWDFLTWNENTFYRSQKIVIVLSSFTMCKPLTSPHTASYNRHWLGNRLAL